MFLTGKGYLGFGNINIQPGDEVFLSERCGRPLILRSNNDFARMRYAIVSACHLEGFMDGPRMEPKTPCEELWIE